MCLTWWHFSLQEPLMHPAVIESWLESTHKSFVWQIQLAQPYQEVHVPLHHGPGGPSMAAILGPEGPSTATYFAADGPGGPILGGPSVA